MARTSRRDKIANIFDATEKTKSEKQTGTRKFQTAIYARLSVEDGGLGKDSESLYNQEQLLLEFIGENPELELVKIYHDNGETGTNFDRPGFDLMMNDLRKGLINCIVVKDLSRFGRNYIEVGEYIEKIFPFMGTRFISMLEHFDNFDPNAQSKDLLVNLKNLMNEAYAKDKSMRICSAFETKRQTGEFNVKNAPFGYKLSGNKKKPYLVDEPAAKIVREIFELKKTGESLHAIMRLMDEKYITPRQYLFEQGLVKKAADNAHWDMTAISRILTNPVYLGHMVQGKTVSRLYQGVQKHCVPKSDWKITENVNEPIVDKATFEEVQRKLTEEADKSLAYRKRGNKRAPENLFKGILHCKECGKSMYRGRTAITPKNIVWYYGCPQYRDHKERACVHKTTIREAELKSVILNFIKSQVKLSDELERRIAEIHKTAQQINGRQSLSDERLALQGRLEKLEYYLRCSFESYLNGILSEDDYLFNKSKYEAEILSCKSQLENLDIVAPVVTQKEVRENPYVISIKKFASARALTREMCTALIERIDIDKNNVVTITPMYRDEFSSLRERIEKEESEMNKHE